MGSSHGTASIPNTRLAFRGPFTAAPLDMSSTQQQPLTQRAKTIRGHAASARVGNWTLDDEPHPRSNHGKPVTEARHDNGSTGGGRGRNMGWGEWEKGNFKQPT